MRQLSRPEGCLSDLALDEWSSGQLDAPARQRVEEHLGTCRRCHARQLALEGERAAFYAAAPSFERHAARFVAGPSPHARTWRFSAVAASVAALAAAAVIALWPSAPPATRSKGAPSIGYFFKRGDHVVPGSATASLQPGDLVRFTYTSAREYHLALFNLDSRAASVYFPAGPRAARVPPGDEIPLDFSVELDATTGVERVYALFCEQDFELEPLRAALLSDRRLAVPSGCQLDRLTLHKVAPP